MSFLPTSNTQANAFYFAIGTLAYNLFLQWESGIYSIDLFGVIFVILPFIKNMIQST